MSKEEIAKKVAEDKRIKLEQSVASTRKLSEYTKDTTTGAIKLPKLTIQTIALIEEMFGSIEEAMNDKFSNIGGILWAILNASNLEVYTWSEQQKKLSIVQFNLEIDLDSIEDYVSAIEELFGADEEETEEGNAEAPQEGQ